jgi:hypothetical protein
MRNAVLAIVVCVLGSAAAHGQSKEWANKLFQESSHDFGGVPRGAQLYHRFPIYNPYAVKMEIITVRTSCGCVAATPSAQVIEPRGKAWLDVTMDARRFTGPKVVSLYVTVGPDYTSTATLQVSANSRADVVFNPGQVSFGVVLKGQAAAQSIDVEYAGVLDWRVTEVVKNDAPVDTVLEELYRRPGQVGYRVRVTMKPDAPAGRLRHELLLKTNDPASPLVPVLVEGTVQASLTVVPSSIAMRPSPKVGDTVRYKVLVSGAKPFKILSVDGVGDGLEADLPTNPAQVQTVVLRYLPPKSGEVKRVLHIKTDLDTNPAVTVELAGNVAP